MSTYDAQTDEDLLAATPSDPEAFAAFYRRHVRGVISFVGRRAPAGEVGDLVAEVFATALVHRRRFDPERGTGRAWLFGIAQHKISDAQRRGAVELKLYRRLGAGRVAAAPEIELDTDEMLDVLPDDQRRAVALRVLSDRTYAQIATDGAVSPQAARKRVSRGLAALRARIMEQEK